MPVPDALPLSAGPVVLRRLRADDLAAFQAYRHDPQVGLYQGWLPVADAEALHFLRRMAQAPLWRPGEWFQLAIATAADDVLAGDIGLCLSSDQGEVEIGFSLARPMQGRGLATCAVQAAIDLAFACTSAARVVAVTDARNLAAIGLLERLGMCRAASHRAVFRGADCVEHHYARGRES